MPARLRARSAVRLHVFAMFPVRGGRALAGRSSRADAGHVPVTSVGSRLAALSGSTTRSLRARRAAHTARCAGDASGGRGCASASRSRFAQPTLVTPERVDQWLRDVGGNGGRVPVELRQSLRARRTPASRSRHFRRAPRRRASYRYCVGLLIARPGFSLSELVCGSRWCATARAGGCRASAQRSAAAACTLDRDRLGSCRPAYSTTLTGRARRRNERPAASRCASGRAGQWFAREGLGGGHLMSAPHVAPDTDEIRGNSKERSMAV